MLDAPPEASSRKGRLTVLTGDSRYFCLLANSLVSAPPGQYDMDRAAGAA